MEGQVGGWMDGRMKRRRPGDDLPQQQNSVRPADLLMWMSMSVPEVKATPDERS